MVFTGQRFLFSRLLESPISAVSQTTKSHLKWEAWLLPWTSSRKVLMVKGSGLWALKEQWNVLFHSKRFKVIRHKGCKFWPILAAWLKGCWCLLAGQSASLTLLTRLKQQLRAWNFVNTVLPLFLPCCYRLWWSHVYFFSAIYACGWKLLYRLCHSATGMLPSICDSLTENYSRQAKLYMDWYKMLHIEGVYVTCLTV